MYIKNSKPYPFDTWERQDIIEYITNKLGRSRFYFKGGGRETKPIAELPYYQLLGIAEGIWDSKQKKKKQKPEVVEIHVYHHFNETEHQLSFEDLDRQRPVTEEERRNAIAECYRILSR